MKQKYQPSKKELLELIGMAELIAVKLEDMGQSCRAFDAESIVKTFRKEFDKICGEEELKRMRDEINRDN